MQVAESVALLTRTPGVLDALLREVPEDWAHRDDGPGTWSAYQITGHLLHGDATNWVPRIGIILAHGTGRTFAPFDRVAMLGWEREPVPALLDRFREGRAAALDALADLGLTDADLDRHGAHPEFGEVRLGAVLAAWVAHDLTHTAQAAETLARRYRLDVGPYRAYLPALDRVAPAE